MVQIGIIKNMIPYKKPLYFIVNTYLLVFKLGSDNDLLAIGNHKKSLSDPNFSISPNRYAEVR